MFVTKPGDTFGISVILQSHHRLLDWQCLFACLVFSTLATVQGNREASNDPMSSESSKVASHAQH